MLINLSQTAGVNIVADKSLPALKQVLSVNLDKVKLGEFLRYVGRNYDLQFQVGDELVWVVDAKDPKRLMEETRFYRLRKGFVLPAEFGAPDSTRTTTTAGPAVLPSPKFRNSRSLSTTRPRPCRPWSEPSRTCSPAPST